ncbi:MAG: hypothetical protein KIH63_000155 [Candidatus Saccharibacteria bacterium]|nr:hypothetical protein [Candidatus Saccharibacteria bacterium]
MPSKSDDGFFERFERRPAVTDSVYIDPLAHNVVQDPHWVPLVECSQSPLVRPSPIHGRNAEDPQQLVLTNQPIYDEFGNYYGAFSIKGADATHPVATYSRIEPSSVRVHGMLDSSTFTRCRDVSRELRGQGVLVEWPLYHARPKKFPDGEGDVGLLEFKYMVYDAYVEMQRAYQRVEPARVEGVGKAGAVAQGLLGMQFGVMYRAMLTNIRVADIPLLAKRGDLTKRLTKSIEALQQRDLHTFVAGEIVNDLDPTKPRDRETYLTTALPSIMGQNLARFHNTGAYHKYPHPGNWSIAGELVDLDSALLASVFPDDAADVSTAKKLQEAFEARHALEYVTEYTDSDPDDALKRFNDAYRTHLDSGGFTQLEMLALESQTRDLQDFMDSDYEPDPYIFNLSLREAASLWYDTLESFADPLTDDVANCEPKLDAASDKYMDALAFMAAEQINGLVADDGLNNDGWLEVGLASMFEATAVAKRVYRTVEDFVIEMVRQKQQLEDE